MGCIYTIDHHATCNNNQIISIKQICVVDDYMDSHYTGVAFLTRLDDRPYQFT